MKISLQSYWNFGSMQYLPNGQSQLSLSTMHTSLVRPTWMHDIYEGQLGWAKFGPLTIQEFFGAPLNHSNPRFNALKFIGNSAFNPIVGIAGQISANLWCLDTVQVQIHQSIVHIHHMLELFGFLLYISLDFVIIFQYRSLNIFVCFWI